MTISTLVERSHGVEFPRYRTLAGRSILPLRRPGVPGVLGHKLFATSPAFSNPSPISLLRLALTTQLKYPATSANGYHAKERTPTLP